MSELRLGGGWIPTEKELQNFIRSMGAENVAPYLRGMIDVRPPIYYNGVVDVLLAGAASDCRVYNILDKEIVEGVYQLDISINASLNTYIAVVHKNDGSLERFLVRFIFFPKEQTEDTNEEGVQRENGQGENDEHELRGADIPQTM